MKSGFSGFFTLAPVLLVVALALRAPAPAAPWADIPNDLPPDPALVRGTLPNGLRYALLPNAEPAGRVSLRLLVAAGSLHENDDERGLAHFVEHMAFRGSRSRPHGELVASLERMGVSFGPDSAAFTGYDNTIYHLDLPDASEQTVRQALQVFRDYAENIEFAPADIERERGVITAEMRTRDTGLARAGQRSLAFIWPTARQLARQPIGVEEQINGFDQKQLRAFYDAWYRPERIAIIAVGQIDPDKLGSMIAAEFAALAPRAPVRPEPPELAPLPPAKELRPLDVFIDKDVFGFNVSLAHAYPEKITAFTPDLRKHYLHESLACHMLQRRITLEARKPDSFTGDPFVTSTQTLPGMRVTYFNISGNLEKWEYVLAYAEQALRRAREHGFDQNEFAAAKASYANNWRQAVRSAPTRQSENLCAEIAGSLMHGDAFSTPETIWQAQEKLLADTTLDDCHAAFKRLWGDAPPRIIISAHEAFSQVERRLIERIIDASSAAVVAAPPKTPPSKLAYKYPGPEGKIATETHLDEHGIHLISFKNNTLLNYKHTDFEKDYVLINTRIGFGLLAQPKTKPGLALLATCGFLSGGVRTNDIADITQIVEQHMIYINFRGEDDALNFTIHCPASETALALRLLTAYVTEPGFHQNAKTLAMPAIAGIYNQQLSSPAQRIAANLERTITGDTRFGLGDFEEPGALNMNDVHLWMNHQLNDGAVEISIVGDITREDAIESVRATFGALPPRLSRADAARLYTRDSMNFGSRVGSPRIDPAITFQQATSPINIPVNPDLKQGAFALVWPVPEKINLHEERSCHLLAHALANAARARLRDELGAAYGVSATFVRHEGFDTFNYFLLQAEVGNARLDEAIATMRDCVARLVADGVGEDEFLRAKKPFVEDFDRGMLTNSYWGYTVLRDAQTNPAHIEAMKNRRIDVASITREEINALAAQHLGADDASYIFKTMPAEK